MLPNITIGTLVRDREWILPRFLQHLYEIDYPKNKIVVMFLINDSSDGSEDLIRKWKAEHRSEYQAIQLFRHDLKAPVDARTEVRRMFIYQNLAILRNEMLDNFLKTHGEYFFSVDSDIMLAQNTLKALLEDNKDIVSAHIYNDSLGTASNSMIIRGNTFKHFNIPMGMMARVDLTGAVYLINRNVIKSGVRYSYSTCGEDAPFCVMAAKAGFELWTDTRIHLEHVMRRE